MQFIDISHDKHSAYRLKAYESTVFFALNRSGEITVELLGEGAVAHIFAFFTGEENDKQTLNIVQKHLAPKTSSSALVKAVLKGKAELYYEGTIKIEKKAQGSNAFQDSRSLLLSPEAGAHTKPALEILADDVACHHAATVSPLNESVLLYIESRGLSRKQASDLLTQGFFQESIEKIIALGVQEEHIPKIL